MAASLLKPGQAVKPRWSWLLVSFVRREILSRYAGSVSGLAWTLLHPLAQLAVFAFVFSQFFRMGLPEGYKDASYTTFVAVALWPWIMFSEGLDRAMGSVVANAGLVRKVAFPHRLLVYSAVITACVIQALGFVAVLVCLRVLGEPIRLAHLPVAFLLLVPYMFLAAGLGAALAALQTLLRDVQHVVQVLLNILFYATPILYSASVLPEGLRAWLHVNPAAWFSERMREVLLLGSGLVWGDAVAALACLAVFGLGLAVFQRLSPHFEDFL